MRCQGLDKDKKRVVFEIVRDGNSIRILTPTGQTYLLVQEQVQRAVTEQADKYEAVTKEKTV